MTKKGIYVGVYSETDVSYLDDIVVEKCVDKIREDYDLVVAFFGKTSEDYINIFNYCLDNDLPILFFNRKYSDRVGDLDVDSIRSNLDNYDILYTENFDIVMMSKKTLSYVLENLKDVLFEKTYIDTMEEIFKHLNNSDLNVETIQL